MTDNIPPQPPGPETKTIYNIYALFGVSIVLSVIPYPSAAILCALFFLIVLVVAYSTRKKAEENSLTENHMTYVIRSLWISALFSLITMGAASFYMLGRVDYASFEACANDIAGQGAAAVQSMSSAEAYAMAEPCVEDFINGNYSVFMISMLIAGGPVILYLGYRFLKGLSRALKGYRLADPKEWF